ncbi:MAG TPA: indole-3-glycerol phosphate synthase TrpC [Candidatus Obscuribacterales bacterium]
MKNTPTSTGTILDEIVAHKREEIAARTATRPLASFRDDVRSCGTNFHQALQGEGIKLIAEIKPKSPSAGQLAEELNLPGIVSAYSKYATGISVLTDERYFGGSLSLLSQVGALTGSPLLCKEFVIESYQVYEARQAGAAAVLLIAKILPDDLLQQLQAVVRELSMTAVIEVQTEDELRRALAVKPDVVLINNRDLTSFEIDLQTTARLAPLVPDSVLCVSASGINARADIDSLLKYTNKFLVGSSLMRSANLEDAMRRLCEK